MNRLAILALVAGLAPSALALDPLTFHLMQIESLVVGVDGDPTVQAIQLRLRAVGQNLVTGGKLIAYDANGLNPILLIDMESNVTNGASGDRVLIVSSAMLDHTDPVVVPDFTMVNLIPESYLAAGRLVFANDVTDDAIWSLAWGGAAYTGPNDGSILNDNDGDYGPPWPNPVSTSGIQSLDCMLNPNQKSTTNAANYEILTTVTLINNARRSYNVILGGCDADCDSDTICDADEDDCDSNGQPDDCEKLADCDANGVPDICQVFNDCDGNGAPDACDPEFCAADLAAPFGVLNVFDFLAFQTGFSNSDPCTDLAAPFGTFNVFDFLSFQTAFGNGC